MNYNAGGGGSYLWKAEVVNSDTRNPLRYFLVTSLPAASLLFQWELELPLKQGSSTHRLRGGGLPWEVKLKGRITAINTLGN